MAFKMKGYGGYHGESPMKKKDKDLEKRKAKNEERNEIMLRGNDAFDSDDSRSKGLLDKNERENRKRKRDVIGKLANRTKKGGDRRNDPNSGYV